MSKDYNEARNIVLGMGLADRKNFRFMNPKGENQIRLVDFYNKLSKADKSKILSLLYASGNEGGNYRDTLTL